MFKVIEYARMMVGTKAIATLATGYLNALDYAKTRVQGADLTQMTDKTAPRVTITHHPDVRRSLMTQKAYAEGLRALYLYTATFQDKAVAKTVQGVEPDLAAKVNDLLLPNVPLGPITEGLGALLSRLDPLLPDINLPTDGLSQPGAPTYANVERINDIVPSDHGQWGLGLKYQVTPITNIGLYHLRYHNTTPAPVQNYGYAVLQELPLGLPPITTAILGIEVPVTYNIKYFDGVHMSAMSFSTALFGANVGGEFIYRDGIVVLVDVDGGILGPVPTPTRGKVAQADINALYSLGPASIGNFPLWDSFTIVGDVGYISVLDVDPAFGPTSSSTDLSYSKDATAATFLLLFDRKNIFSGWDLQTPAVLAAAISGQTSLLSGFGSLMGGRDRRPASASISPGCSGSSWA